MAVVVLGVLRRVIPLLERVSVDPRVQPEFGAEVGTRVEPFSLETRAGEPVAWNAFVPGRSFLVVASSSCKTCGQLADELVAAPDSIDGIHLVVVHDDPQEGFHPELERRGVVLYQTAGQATSGLQNRAVPQAYLVDSSGLVLARKIVHSVDELRELVPSAGRRVDRERPQPVSA